MSLNGIIVFNQGGINFYSKIVEIELKLNPVLISGFLSAIQTFAQGFQQNQESNFRQINMQDFNIIFRKFKYITFLGITKQNTNIKATEVILEYMIWAFLSKFRHLIPNKKFVNFSNFRSFDDLFLKYRSSKEKELKKWLTRTSSDTNKLQGILNKLINYFPINELVNMHPEKLIIIGNKLIWVDLSITPEEELQLINEVRKKTNSVYGPDIFKTIENEVKVINNVNK